MNSALDWEVIIVDDNSPDGTQDIARQLQNAYGGDKIVSRLHSLRPTSLKFMRFTWLDIEAPRREAWSWVYINSLPHRQARFTRKVF
jgi:glycosyltransferase involved in cell wall biosynthesis